MENLLVTGGAGFIGVNFIRYLLTETGFKGRVINVDKLTYAGNPESLDGIDKRFSDRYDFIKADICDRERLARVFDEHDVDSVCHFAAESHVDRSIVSAEDFIKTNILGTFNLLELARERADRIRLFHHISTDEVFGDLDAGGYSAEDAPYWPNSPYSASKASSNHLARAYYKTYGLPVTISNCSNNYGPYQFPEKLIPLMILNALEGKPLPIYGNGMNVREWLYVHDHCVAVKTIMDKESGGGTYNIGGGNEITNIRVVEMICDMLDEILGRLPDGKPRRELITLVPDRPGHDRRYAIDWRKINSKLGWRPSESFESGLRKTIDWYLTNKTWVDRVRSSEYRRWIDAHYG
ncbi:MAG TPA: dTDP-glucose 4,6-dehydratase [Thermodesulfobacteriota bacterium]|nr:dTDP-glucose 4,6-dehydratase [Thermodesulfobacteriota bacterium]